MADQQLIVASDFASAMEEAVKLFERGYNLFEVCQKLGLVREDFAAWVKDDTKRLERITEARRQGADCLVSTYKDLLMKEYKSCDDPRDRISILKEIGNHIRWEAQAVHSGTYSPKQTVEHKGKLTTEQVVLTEAQVMEMAKEVLAKPGDSFAYVKH